MPQLIIELIGDASNLNRVFKNTAKDARTFEARITRAGRGLNKAFAAAGVTIGIGTVIAGISDAVNAASDLSEQMSKTEVVFGESADEIKTWSKTTATAFGIAERQALATASSFGALFAPLGIVGQESADQSRQLTQLGADLASFYNTDVQDALDALRSGLVGETEPLRRYGVLLSETRVTAEALAQTGKKNADALTQQEKVMARVALIFRDSAQAQGDFARTSGGFANQMRILNAQFDQLKATLGTAFLPRLTEVVTKMNEWLADTENQDRLLANLERTVETAAATLESFANAIETVVDAGKRWYDITEDINRISGDLPGGDAGLGERIAAGIFGRSTVENFKQLVDRLRETNDELERADRLLDGLDAHSRMATQAILDAHERASRTAVAHIPPQSLVPGRLTGRAFIGTTVTAAQLRALELARTAGTGTDAEMRAIRAEVAADEKALAFALRMMQTQGKNQKRFADEAARLTTEIAAGNQRLESIADDRQQAVKAEGEAIAALFKAPVAFPFIGGPTLAAAVRQNVTEMNRRAQAQQQASQFVALGLTRQGEELAPTRQALKSRLNTIEKALAGSILDTSANRNLIARVRKVLALQFGALTRETKLAIDRLLGVFDTLEPKQGGPLFRKVSTAKLAERLGISGLEARAILAGIGAGGTVPAGRSAAFSGAGATVVNIGTLVSSAPNYQQLETELVRRSKARPHMRRGVLQ